MKLPEIIGVAGTNASGKDTLADLRLERQNVRKVSLSDILRVEATRRGLEHHRETLGLIGAEWSKQFGAAALALMTLKEYQDTKTEDATGISIVSIRRIGEAQAIQEADGLVLWVDAEREERYRRIQKASRDRIDDLVTFEEFCAQEDFEMHPVGDDPFLMNMAGIRDIADIHLENNFVDTDSQKGEDQYRRYLADRFEI